MNFKQYLNEARMAPLYHATSLDNFISIVDSGFIEPRTKHSNKKLLKKFDDTGTIDKKLNHTIGISLTRNFQFAKNWRIDGCILELDQNELSKRFKIIPFQYWQTRDHFTNKILSVTRNSSSEYEEFVITNKGIPFNDTFVKRIYVKFDVKQEYEKYKDVDLTNLTDEDYIIKFGMYVYDIKERLKSLEWLIKYSRLVKI